MTEKLYLITEAQRDAQLHTLHECFNTVSPETGPLIESASTMLQSLPMVDSQPAAFMFHTDEYDEIGGLAPLPSKRDLLEIGKLGATVIPLYTSPQVLAPITAEDVTDEMVDKALRSNNDGATPYSTRKAIASAVNAYLGVKL